MAYFSKQLDRVTLGWPACLRAANATALLIVESEKLTFRKDLEVRVIRAVKELLQIKCSHWLTTNCLTK